LGIKFVGGKPRVSKTSCQTNAGPPFWGGATLQGIKKPVPKCWVGEGMWITVRASSCFRTTTRGPTSFGSFTTKRTEKVGPMLFVFPPDPFFVPTGAGGRPPRSAVGAMAATTPLSTPGCIVVSSRQGGRENWVVRSLNPRSAFAILGLVDQNKQIVGGGTPMWKGFPAFDPSGVGPKQGPMSKRRLPVGNQTGSFR